MAPIHDGIKRRHFLKALGSALVGVAAATVVPANPDPAGGIKFHPKAFSASMEAIDFRRKCVQPAVDALVKEMDTKALAMAYSRIDVLYGYAVLNKPASCVVLA